MVFADQAKTKSLEKEPYTPMAKVTPITEHFQHFVQDLKESFWGDLQGQTQRAAKRFFELLSERQRDLYMVRPRYSRGEKRKDYRNGYYQRDFVTRFGTLRLRIARSRKKGFLPAVLKKFQRRAEEVSLLIREAFLRGISTRQVGRVVATWTGEVVSAQTVSRLTRDLDALVYQFHQARLEDDWAYLFLDGVSLRVRRPSGRKRVQMLVTYGVKKDGRRQLLAFLRSQGESQGDWEALLNDLYRRGLQGKSLHLIVTDGCPGLAAAIKTRVPARRSSTVLGAQDAQHLGKSAPARSRRGQSRCPGHLFGGKPREGRSHVSQFPSTLATRLHQLSQAIGARFT